MKQLPGTRTAGGALLRHRLSSGAFPTLLPPPTSEYRPYSDLGYNTAAAAARNKVFAGRPPPRGAISPPDSPRTSFAFVVFLLRGHCARFSQNLRDILRVGGDITTSSPSLNSFLTSCCVDQSVDSFSDFFFLSWRTNFYWFGK